MLETLLYSKAEVDVLGIVLFEDGLHLREIARRAKRPAPQAMRELNRLVRAGLLRHDGGEAEELEQFLWPAQAGKFVQIHSV